MSDLERIHGPTIKQIRGVYVILDADLAALFGVPTRQLIQAVTRNRERFPADFFFRLEDEEWETLRSQVVTSNSRGGRRYAPYAFTEHGVAMAASVLRSPSAIAMSIEVIRQFVRLRQAIQDFSELEQRMAHLEARMDDEVRRIWSVLHDILVLPDPAAKRLGFRQDEPA
jgi:hypothetical protein